MLKKPARSNSVFAIYAKPHKKDKRKKFSREQFDFSIIAGATLSLVTFLLQLIAYVTPHWKEISPNTHSLYVDGVDALIRTEVLHFFNTVHRSTRHSYGLFQRCEYLVNNNSSAYNHQPLQIPISNTFWQKKCTKNFLPSYADDHFDECHSLQYYRFCTKSSEKTFDININYLRATFDLTSTNSHSILSCDCHYPLYIKACQILGAFALLFLFITFILYSLFPLFQEPRHRLKVKCFGVLASLLAILFIIINLSIILSHIEFESIEYLIAIERHYKMSQIYKLSQDTKLAIERFLASITIKIGYSAILTWIAFALSIIDAFLLMTTCKIHSGNDETTTDLVRSQSSPDSSEIRQDSDNDENSSSKTPLTFAPMVVTPSPPPPPRPPSPPVTLDLDEQSTNRSPSTTTTIPTSVRLPVPRREQNYPPRIHFGDEV